MGSVAPLRRAPDRVRDLFHAIHRHALERAAEGLDPDYCYVRGMLVDAYSDPSLARHLSFCAAELICAALMGVHIDLSSWTPPQHS